MQIMHKYDNIAEWFQISRWTPTLKNGVCESYCIFILYIFMYCILYTVSPEGTIGPLYLGHLYRSQTLIVDFLKDLRNLTTYNDYLTQSQIQMFAKKTLTF